MSVSIPISTSSMSFSINGLQVNMKFVGNTKLEWMMELENDPKI